MHRGLHRSDRPFIIALVIALPFLILAPFAAPSAPLLASGQGVTVAQTDPAQPSHGLFAPAPDGALAGTNAASPLLGVRRARGVTLNRGALALAEASGPLGRVLNDPGLLLNLFDDAALMAVNTRLTPRPMGRPGYTWFGTIPSIPHSDVIMVIDPLAGTLTGRVMTPTATYYIAPTGGSGALHRIHEVDPRAWFNDPQNRLPTDALELDAHLPPSALDGADTLAYPRGTILSEPNAEIDILALYTPAAAAILGGDAGAQMAIEEMIALTNQSYVNSNVSQRVRLVQIEPVDFVENPAGSDLNALTSINDGQIDSIHALRDVYGADLVALITGTPNDQRNYCGIAWVLSGNARGGFSVSEALCVTTVVMPHELGHNMGNLHDQTNSGGIPGWFSYSYGYQDVKEFEGDWGDFVTIMAYGRNGQCPPNNPLSPVGEGQFCPHIPYWSDPQATYNGKPLGNNNTRAAQTLDQTSGIVAGFRPKRAVTSMLTDPGFEAWGAGPQTATWRTKRLKAADRVICNPKQASNVRSQSCAFRFVGQTGEDSLIRQRIPANTLTEGDLLMASAWVRGDKLGAGAMMQVRVNYQAAGKAQGKLDIAVPKGTYPYRELYGTLPITDPVSSVVFTVRFRHPAAKGRFFVDDTRLLAGQLLAGQAGLMDSSPGVVPLPNAP